VKNPFDYAYPITDPELFAGRRRELAEIDYYIGLAETQRSSGLAIVGQRTSGKTSLLNMAECCATAHHRLPVRLDLTTADVSDELSFLSILYEALFLAGKTHAVWGDRTPDIYSAFRDAMSGANQAQLRDFCDIAFPQASADARKGLQPFGSFPARLLVSDLDAFRTSCLSPVGGIALLIDEGDLLARLPVALEKLRYVMGVAEGLVVVVAGTNEMLGSMDLVFAPIVRQFKRINLAPFISPSETRQCLQQRLERAGKQDVMTQGLYRELHELAQGQPYEAQLIAHFAYRRFAEQPSEGFGVTVSVLNEVLAQVETFRESDHDRFAVTLQKYDADALRRLAAVVLFPRLSLYDKARVDVALKTSGRVKERITARRKELKGWAERFVDDRIIVFNPTTKGYEINGNQFDRLYAKLLATTKQIHWIIDDRPLVELAEEQAALVLSGAARARRYPALILEDTATEKDSGQHEESELAFVETRPYQVMGRIFRHVRSWRFREEMRRVLGALNGGGAIGDDVWAPTIMTEIGKCAVLAGLRGLPTARVRLENEAENRQSEIWLQPADLDTTAVEWDARVRLAIAEHTPGMSALGWTGELVCVDEEGSGRAGEILASAVMRGWDVVREEILDEIASVTVERYASGDLKRAQELADLGSHHSIGADRWRHVNNHGYLLVASGEYEKAAGLLRESCEAIKQIEDLPHYNLAVCLALMGSVDEARLLLKNLVQRMTTERVAEETPCVLFVVRRSDDGKRLEREEQRDLALREAVRRSERAVAETLLVG
jgi:hypothetical protein